MAVTLIVDDDAIHARMLVEVLDEAGLEARAASGVLEAVSALRIRPHALVVSDVRMGDGDGFALMRALRDEGKRVPVILMSSYAARETQRRARDEGAFAFLAKPFPLQDLLALVELALETPDDGP